MGVLESQKEDTPKRILWYTPMGFLGVIRPHHRDESWSSELWQSFFTTCVGEDRLVVAKSLLDVFGDHVSTCTAHSGAKKAHDWAVEQLADLFRTTQGVKTQQVARSLGQ